MFRATSASSMQTTKPQILDANCICGRKNQNCVQIVLNLVRENVGEKWVLRTLSDFHWPLSARTYFLSSAQVVSLTQFLEDTTLL